MGANQAQADQRKREAHGALDWGRRIVMTDAERKDQWCTLVSDAILFVYGISIPEDRLWNESLTGKLDKPSVMEAFQWAQAVALWKTDQSDEAVWPGHITPALWPLFWEVAFRVDRERTLTAIGYALTAFAYREYDAGKDQKSLDRHLPAGSPAASTPTS
jgi:hypothetical protein